MIFFSGPARSFAEAANDYDLGILAHRYLPLCHLRTNATGKVDGLVSATGEVLELAAAGREQPQPTNSVVGYWFAPTMDFLSRQRPKAGTPEEAAGLVQLMHSLWRGPAFVRQKLYEARAFEGGWVVQVEHDFTNYPSSVLEIMPYELLVDEAGRVVQFRQRCYFYRGSPVVYTNTVISVYQRELRRNGGRDYPGSLFAELKSAWEKEKKQNP